MGELVLGTEQRSVDYGLEQDPCASIYHVWQPCQSGQGVYFDDAQVQLCYATGPIKVYLPIVTKSPPQTGPTCTPYEPDNRDNRGSVTVGATCNGSFGPSDDKDYYTLNLAGVTDVKLRLFNLPPEGNRWDAAIYEYPYTGQQPACWIGKEGLDKSEDCRGLNLNKTYFVLVAAGSAQSSPKSYIHVRNLALRACRQPTPTSTPPSQPGPTPGFWSSTSGDEFYVSPDRANVLKFAIYINVYTVRRHHQDHSQYTGANIGQLFLLHRVVLRQRNIRFVHFCAWQRWVE